MQTEEDTGSCEAGVTGNCEKVDMGAGNGSTVVGKSKHSISPDVIQWTFSLTAASNSEVSLH